MIKKFGVSTNEIYQEPFLKGVVTNHYTKGAKDQLLSWSILFIVFYYQNLSMKDRDDLGEISDPVQLGYRPPKMGMSWCLKKKN